MATIDRELVRAINSGRCFAFVGAGPSCQIGIPSWSRLTEIAVASLDPSSHQSHSERCKKLLADKNYPAVFSTVEKVIGQAALLELIQKTLTASRNNGTVYEYLARWPFATYLTTNYDDYLATYLRKEELSFVTKRNTKDDFKVLRAESKGVIFKIHGDCSTADDIVLTEEQYDAFRNAPERNYWREKIRSVLHMVNVVLVGTSASDPDFNDQLEMAKDIADPEHPIFMFAADIPDKDIQKYFEFNIRVITYTNRDGAHRELHRLLKRYDPFIAKRKAPHLGQEPIDEEGAQVASSMHLFTRLNLSDAQTSCLKKSYQALIVGSLGNAGHNTTVSLEQLQGLLGKKLHVEHVDPQALQDALQLLYDRGLITTSLNMEEYSLSSAGIEMLETTKAERQLRTERFSEECRLYLSTQFPEMGETIQDAVIRQLDVGLIRAFERRGAEMAQATFGSGLVDLSTAADILETVNSQSSLIPDETGRAAFADLMLEILLQPSAAIKEQLADLSQGFFSYHALGLDSKCSAERLDMAKSKAWIFDSSIILPLLATDCVNHGFARDILERMKALGLRLYTTGRLFREVIDHAYWAIRNFKNAPSDSSALLQAAACEPGYDQNLFVDGYMKWSSRQSTSSLSDYFSDCLGRDYDTDLGKCICERIVELGIEIVEFSEWPNFREELWGDRERITNEIVLTRKERGTYHNDEQCRAEAEVLILCENQKAAFLSQSGILDSIDRDKPRITWKPESMYRFLSSFSALPPSEDLLYQSMVQDFFYGGFDIVNSEALRVYFSGPVRQSRMDLDEEKERYENVLGSMEYRRLRSGYEQIPDIQKPFYSMRFAFYVARKEREKRELAEAREQASRETAEAKAREISEIAEARIRRAEEEQGLRVKEKEEYLRLKAEKAERAQRSKKKHRRQASQNKGNKKKGK